LQVFAEQISQLAQENRDTRRDLERERIAGRYAQERLENLSQELKAAEESVVSMTAGIAEFPLSKA
jgi:hypothetical protein